LPRLASNLDPLNLSLPSSWDYRREPPVPASQWLLIANTCNFAHSFFSPFPPHPASLAHVLVWWVEISSCQSPSGDPSPPVDSNPATHKHGIQKLLSFGTSYKTSPFLPASRTLCALRCVNVGGTVTMSHLPRRWSRS
jgi:hypothetical protein